MVCDLFGSKHKNKKAIKKKKKKNFKGNKVLLVDQVDTFFSKDFYGNTYNPGALLQNNDII